MKEKILAGKRAGIKEYILCKDNEKDILECAKLGNIAGFITAQSMDTVSKNISEKNLLNFGGSYEIRKIFNS